MASGETAPSLSATIAEFVHGSTWRDLPGAVVQIARQHLLDTIGCCLAATKVDTSRLLRTWLLAEGGGCAGDCDRHAWASASATGGVHERAARTQPRIRRHGDAGPAPGRRGRANPARRIGISGQFGNRCDRRHRAWPRAVHAYRLGGVRQQGEDLAVPSARPGFQFDLRRSRRRCRGGKGYGAGCQRNCRRDRHCGQFCGRLPGIQQNWRNHQAIPIRLGGQVCDPGGGACRSRC